MLTELSAAPSRAGNTVQMLDEGISMQEYLQRVARVRAALGPENLVGLVAFGDCWRGANVSYFNQFRPMDEVSDIANAVVFIGIDSEPVLFVSEQCLGYASSVTGFEVCLIRQMGERLRRFAKAHPFPAKRVVTAPATAPGWIWKKKRRGSDLTTKPCCAKTWCSHSNPRSQCPMSMDCAPSASSD